MHRCTGVQYELGLRRARLPCVAASGSAEVLRAAVRAPRTQRELTEIHSASFMTIAYTTLQFIWLDKQVPPWRILSLLT